jgi:hypothetical protein
LQFGYCFALLVRMMIQPILSAAQPLSGCSDYTKTNRLSACTHCIWHALQPIRPSTRTAENQDITSPRSRRCHFHCRGHHPHHMNRPCLCCKAGS